jgi:hypothetical protein
VRARAKGGERERKRKGERAMEREVERFGVEKGSV